MKNQKLSHIASRLVMICVCLLALTAVSSVVNAQPQAKPTPTPLSVPTGNPTPIPNSKVAIENGLQAAAEARGKTKGKVVTPGDSGKVSLALYDDVDKLTRDDVNRGAEVGVVYVSTASKERPAGYYYVKLLERPPSAEVIYEITLTPTQTDGAAERRQYQPLLIRKRIDKSSPLMKAGTGSLNLSTLGGEIAAAVEQSIVNTTKSNVKEH